MKDLEHIAVLNKQDHDCAVAKLPPQDRQPQHASSGKKIRKKDLGMIAKSYGYGYVAHEQNASGILPSGASQAQYFCLGREHR